MIVRENTEGLYSGLEHIVIPGVVESLRVITEKGSERIVRYAFELARRHGRKKVTAVHKANILKLSDGLFLEVARRVAREFPDIGYEEAIVDATAMKLVIDPSQFDVLVMENLFGDIVSDLTAGLVGGLGLAPSANIGEKAAMFEAVHGSAPDIAGRGIANPTALILAGAMMLHHLGDHEGGTRVEDAVRRVLERGEVKTADLGGTASTAAYTEALIVAIGAARR
jgi:isocitrate dehydrogenase (NAD+)